MEAQPLLGGVGLAEKQRHLVGVGAGHQTQAPLLGGVADSLVAQHLQHRRQFQRANGFFKHFTHK